MVYTLGCQCEPRAVRAVPRSAAGAKERAKARHTTQHGHKGAKSFHQKRILSIIKDLAHGSLALSARDLGPAGCRVYLLW